MDYFKSFIVWLIGIVFLVVFFPVTFVIWLLVLPFDRERRVIHRILNIQSLIFSRLMPFWKIDIRGREKAEKNHTYVIISNHQSILDILIINCLGYRLKWISKIENKKVPILGWYLKMAGYITVDRDDRDSKDKMLAESYDCLKRGISLMLFPEGTRSPDGEIRFFKRGAFQLALSADVPILPVLIDGTGDVLPKHGLIFGGFHRIRVRVLDPVFPEEFSSRVAEDLAADFEERLRKELDILRNAHKQ